MSINNKNKAVTQNLMNAQKAAITDPSFDEHIQNLTDTGPVAVLEDSFLSANNSVPSEDIDVRGNSGQVYVQPEA